MDAMTLHGPEHLFVALNRIKLSADNPEDKEYIKELDEMFGIF